MKKQSDPLLAEGSLDGPVVRMVDQGLVHYLLRRPPAEGSPEQTEQRGGLSDGGCGLFTGSPLVQGWLRWD